MFSNTEFNHLKLKLDQLYLSLSGGKVNGETVFSKKVTFGSGDKVIKIYDGKIEGLDSPGGHTYDLELDGTQLTLTEDSEDKTTVQIPSTVVGACTTAAATAAKVVTLTDVTDFELTKGTVIVVKFTNTNTAQNPTLNVNGTGAKSIYYNTSVVTTSNLWVAAQANRYMEYMYDGTNWVWISQCFDNNTTYSAMSKSELTTGTATTSRVVRADYLKKGIEEIIKTPITDIVNVYGAKNLCPTMNPSDPSTTSLWSSYFKINADNSITANGTSSSRVSIASRVVLPAGQYIMNGCPRGGNWNTYRLLFLKYTPSEVVVYSDRGSTPTTVTLDEETEIVIRVDLYGGYTASNLTFKPMIRLASIQDDTYVPYAKTNKELTDAFTNQVANSDDAYSPSKAYKVGEHCIYNNVIYKCITACSAAAWSVNQNCFEPTTLTTAITELNSDLNVVTTTTFTNSTWLDGSKSTLHRLGKLRILHIYPKSGVVLSQAVVITLGTADIPSQDVSMDNMGLDGNRGRVGIQASTGYVYLFGSGTVNNAVYSIIYVVD